MACGQIVRQVLDGDYNLDDGMAIYREFVARHRWMFRVLRGVQALFTRLSPTVLALPASLLTRPGVLHPIMWAYYRLFHLRNPKPLPIPGQLAGLPLTRHTFGRPAADEIARLHGGSTGSPRSSSFPLTGATVADYGDGAAIVWASQTWGQWGAQYLVRSMTKA